MKKLKIIFMILAMTLVLFACKRADVKAATDNGVSLNVPSKMDIIFNEDGTATVDDMYLENASLVPVELQNINIKEFNDWEIVPKSQEILVNSKQVSLQMGDKELVAGSNVINREVAEGEKYDFDVTVNRGAWTETVAPEKAMEMELEYQIGKKQFVLTLDGNGYPVIETVNAVNGQPITLPKPVREGYELAGWQDEDGNVYNGVYYMPIGDVTLKAVWRELTAYALYCSSDGSLTFVQSADVIKAGDTHNGKTVTSVYTGFEETNYTSYSKVPWYAGGISTKIKSVLVEDKITPINTAYWFYGLENCQQLDLAKLCTSKVTNMFMMFYRTCVYVEDDVTITGLEEWDVSNVTDMRQMFEYCGTRSTTFNIGNIGTWDVSSVTSTQRMFVNAGNWSKSFYIGDLSNWDTRSLTNSAMMFYSAGKKAESFHIGDIGNWNMSNVTYVSSMFAYAGQNAKTFYIGDIGKWNVGKVINFNNMFEYTGQYATNFNIGNLGNWNVSSAQEMFCMFSNTAQYSSTFYIGDLSKWNVSNVTTMGYMFNLAGQSASWSLNCRGWNVGKVISHDHFNDGVTGKVTAPVWVN